MHDIELAGLSDKQAVALINAIHAEPEAQASDHFEVHQTPELDREHA